MIALLVCLFLGCLPQTAPDAPVLRVNGEAISRSVYRDWLLAQRGEFLLDAFVLHRRVLRMARAEGCLVPTEDIVARLEDEIRQRVDGAFGGDRARWIEELTAAGRSESGRRAERRIDLEVDRNLAAIVEQRHPIQEDALRAEWQRLFGADGKRLKARLLFRRFVQESVPGESREQRRERRERGLDVLRKDVQVLRQRVVDQGEDFEALIRSTSEDTATRSAGGLVPDGLDLRGWPAEAIAAVEALEEGSVSEPLFARGGFWLVRSEGWVETRFEDVRESLEARLRALGPDGSTVAALRAELTAGIAQAVRPALLRDGPPEESVLVVDGEDVARAELQDFVVRFRGEHHVRRFAENWAIRSLAAAEGITVTAADVSARVDESVRRTIEALYGGDREAWLTKVRGAGRSEESHRRELADRELEWLLLERLMRLERAPTDPELRSLWTRTYGPGGRRISARWISTAMVEPELAPDATPEQVRAAYERARSAARRAADDVAARLASGEDFGALARELSDDSETAARGGEPAPGTRFEDWIKDPDGLLGEITIGRLTSPIEFQGAFWIFEILDVTQVPFEAVRASLLERARDERPDELVLLEYRRERIGDPVVELLPAFSAD